MVALVERGAPRDFRDIFVVCQAELTTPAQCWALWQQRQQLVGNDLALERATLAVQLHLERIIQYRPLDKIANAEDRTSAQQVRTWFIKEFIHEGYA